MKMAPATNASNTSDAGNSIDAINGKLAADRNGLPSLSMAVDIGEDDTEPCPEKQPQPSFWARLSKAATIVEEHLAEFFGLNDAKYQWAVDEALSRQLAGESQVKPAPTETPDELLTEPTSHQTMHRDTN